jgi:hypothetical protein
VGGYSMQIGSAADDDILLSGASTKNGILQRALLALLRQHEEPRARRANAKVDADEPCWSAAIHRLSPSENSDGPLT